MTDTEVRVAEQDADTFDGQLREMLVGELERRWSVGPVHVDEACRHSLLPVGKLFRPVLLLASVDAVNGDIFSALPAAISAECGHVASLIHDDIIDGDALRRGRPTVHAKYGVDEAIISGDLLLFYLFACLTECSDTGIPAARIVSAVGAIAGAGLDLCRGQSMESDLTASQCFDAESYFEMVRLKTSALFRASCQVGAILGGGDAMSVDLLIEYANHLGVAFQIHDDLLAYISDEQQAGKKASSDIRNRRLVLPVILAYHRESEGGRREIETCLSGRLDDDEALGAMTAILRRTGALEDAVTIATQHAEEALSVLSLLPPSQGRDLLAEYAVSVVCRANGKGPNP